MATSINGRVVEVILIQNQGNTDYYGAELDISSYVLSLGNISWSIDENLTKLSLGNLSLSVTDDAAGTVWSFLTTGIVSSSGILPPWLVLNVDGTQRFIGLIKESPVRSEDGNNLEISINAVDWSSMLESKRITTDNGLSRINDFRTGVSYSTGTTINCNSDYNKELRRGHYRQTVYVDISEQNNFHVNDWVYFNNYSSFSQYNKKYQITQAYISSPGGQGAKLTLNLGSGFWWTENPGDPQNYRQYSTLYRVFSSTSTNIDTTTNLPSFVVAEDFNVSTAGNNPKTSIKLTYVDGLQPGDTLNKLTNILSPNDPAFTITIVDVDVTTNTIYLDAPLNNNLVNGVTSFTISSTSINESVLVPLMSLVNKSVSGLALIDYSSYQAAVLPSPAFSFISPKSPETQNTHTETLSGIYDIQPSLTGFQVVGTAGKAWTGLPSTGWDTLATYTKMVNWTEQVPVAPSYLMPYLSVPSDANTDSDNTVTRGRTKYTGLGDLKNIDDGPVNPTHGTTPAPVYKYVYDYSSLTCYKFKFSPSGSCLKSTWNGATWSADSSVTVSGLGQPVDILPFKDATSTISGYGLLALYANGTVQTLLSTLSSTITLAGDDIKNKNGTLQVSLKQTSNGIYYFTPTGYGKIWISAGVLKSKWVKILDDSNSKNQLQTITPLLNTFIYSNGQLITLAKVSYKTSIADERFIDDTYLLRLNKDIQDTAKDSVLSVDFIVKNIPRATMAVKSPVSEDIFGFMGGRVFQITKSLPDTVERFSSINQTASAIIEFVCSMTNSVATPFVTGKIKLYSRGFNNTPVNINVDQVSIKENRWNKHLADCIVIKGKDSKAGVAVSTTQLAGLTISYSNDIYIRNPSQAQAIAESYLAFFEKPRREVEQEWFSQSYPAVWETLSPMDIITVNGGSTQYYLTSLSHSLENQTATVTLLEVV
jgi:hypothetical protein